MENIETPETIEKPETIETVEKIETIEIQEKKPRKKMNLSDEERKKRSDRMKLARDKKMLN